MKSSIWGSSSVYNCWLHWWTKPTCFLGALSTPSGPVLQIHLMTHYSTAFLLIQPASKYSMVKDCLLFSNAEFSSEAMLLWIIGWWICVVAAGNYVLTAYPLILFYFWVDKDSYLTFHFIDIFRLFLNRCHF